MAAMSWPAGIFELDAGQGLAVCIVHQGAHAFYMGACVAFAAKRRRMFEGPRLRHCNEPGCNFAEEVPHSHQPPVEPVRVAIDEERLAAGIAIALDQLMQKRRAGRTASTSAEAQSSARNGEGVPLGGVPTVT
jgi:hypothetical protein